MAAIELFQDVMPVEVGLVSLQLVDPPTLEKDGMQATLRLVIWEPPKDGSGEKSIRDIKEQQCIVLPAAWFGDPRLPLYWKAWARHVVEKLKGDVEWLLPHELFPAQRLHPLKREELTTEDAIVEALAAAGSAERRPLVPAPKAIASHPELEAAIAENPDDLARWQVYADFLQERGDPRGELVALEIKAASGDLEAAAAAGRLFGKHEDLFAGPMADYDEQLTLGWKMGFVESARMGLTYEDHESGISGVDLVRTLLTHPSALFLRSLTLGTFNFEGDNDYSQMLEALFERPRPALRSVFVGDTQPDEQEISWTRAGDLSRLSEVARNLKKLKVRAGSMTLGALDLPKLEELVLETGGLSKASFQAVSDAHWPSLERLELWFGSDNYGAECRAEDLADLLGGVRLPKLKKLGLRNAEFTDALMPALASSKLLAQVEELDLSMGILTDRGAETIVANAACFAHLKRLIVDRCFLSGDALARLARLGLELSAGRQQTADEYDGQTHYYVAVGE
ncbi:MAG: TIGR02996 domain-containing protein [Myxococcales bacterium]